MQYRIDVLDCGRWRKEVAWQCPEDRDGAAEAAVRCVTLDGYERSQLLEKEQDSVLPWRVVLEVAR